MHHKKYYYITNNFFLFISMKTIVFTILQQSMLKMGKKKSFDNNTISFIGFIVSNKDYTL